ncbi:MAG TPA: DUF3492 domain-containing protein [Aquifex aeolicus]|nr:DUF3492 domain-containing protein [Aquifex aeolicus]
MRVIIDKKIPIDVLFIVEGTYPFIRGGVSTWIHQIITGMPDINFGILFLGSREEDYEGIKYELPNNLVFLSTYFLFSKSEQPKAEYIKGSEDVCKLKVFLKENMKIPEEIISIDFYEKKIPFSHFLYGKQTFEMMENLYTELSSEMPFIDFFWTVRNILSPLWVVVKSIYDVLDKEIKLIHSPSTGYAGFLGALLKKHKGIPFIITEHGIYTRERKIDILNAHWTRQISGALVPKYDIDEIKKLWINFFLNLGRIAYIKADKVFSLFEDARQVQIKLGCPPEKTGVIPNGVKTRKDISIEIEELKSIPPIVALIGRVTPIKDIKTFIKAMKILIDKYPHAEGWIVGPEEEDRDYVRECKLMVNALGVEDKVKFLGFQRIDNILPKVGIVSLTSISEGMPMVILEAFSWGIPCVATDVGSCRQLIYGGLNDEDICLGKAGKVTPVGNPEKIAEAYYELLTDMELWKRCRLTAIKRVNKFYSFDSFINSYRNVYESLIRS